MNFPSEKLICTLKPYLAMILAATEAPEAAGERRVSPEAGRGEDSCKEGGGAIATPTPLGRSTISSSSSSLSFRVPANEVAMFGIGIIFLLLSSGVPGSNRLQTKKLALKGAMYSSQICNINKDKFCDVKLKFFPLRLIGFVLRLFQNNFG